MGKLKHKKPQENLLRSKYHEKLKELKSACKSKRFYFWQNKFDEIENSLYDSKGFWNKCKNASEYNAPDRQPDITGTQLFNHFSNLHTGTAKYILEDSIVMRN